MNYNEWRTYLEERIPEMWGQGISSEVIRKKFAIDIALFEDLIKNYPDKVLIARKRKRALAKVVSSKILRDR